MTISAESIATDVMYAAIFIHCVCKNPATYTGNATMCDSLEASIRRLNALKKWITDAVYIQIYNLIYELNYFVDAGLRLRPPTSFSPMTTPRLIPFIYSMIGLQEMYYRSTDKFTFHDSVLEIGKLEKNRYSMELLLRDLENRITTSHTLIEQFKLEKDSINYGIVMWRKQHNINTKVSIEDITKQVTLQMLKTEWSKTYSGNDLADKIRDWRNQNSYPSDFAFVTDNNRGSMKLSITYRDDSKERGFSIIDAEKNMNAAIAKVAELEQVVVSLIKQRDDTLRDLGDISRKIRTSLKISHTPIVDDIMPEVFTFDGELLKHLGAAFSTAQKLYKSMSDEDDDSPQTHHAIYSAMTNFLNKNTIASAMIMSAQTKIGSNFVNSAYYSTLVELINKK